MRSLRLGVTFSLLLSAAMLAQGRGGRGSEAPPPLNLPADTARIAQLKNEAVAEIDKMKDVAQQMNDQIFSFAELGFQEFETQRYLVNVLRQNGFNVEEGVAGIPTSFMATWGNGKPVIALGSDFDDIPKASQKPGVAYHDPIIEGAPGHGEGHNSGNVVNVVAATVLKKIMERDKIPGTIRLWPGVAEEQLGTKAYYVRAGLFKDVDAVLFTHVGNNLSTSWGGGGGTGMVSVEYSFKGETAHSAGAPWRGRSALDAVELMNIGWNFQREHLPVAQRSHYVITNGGDQPNVVPAAASVWYYLRQPTYEGVKEMWATADRIARGAAAMTNTELLPMRVLGSAWPGHFNRALAEAAYANIQKVGLPQWSDDDQTLARALQKELGVNQQGLPSQLSTLSGPSNPEQNLGGGSDDIGDISWNVPTITIRYPSNIPGLPGHNWANAVAMATPIAHKGNVAGAKAQAMTMLDILLKPELLAAASDYFKNVQTKDQKYEPLIRPQDQPAIDLNKEIMATYREQMKKFYYDPSKYKTYMEQLGIQYPTVRK